MGIMLVSLGTTKLEMPLTRIAPKPLYDNVQYTCMNIQLYKHTYLLCSFAIYVKTLSHDKETYSHRQMHIHTYIHTYMHACMHACNYITLHYISIHYITLHYTTLHYIHTYIHTCIHTYTYIHTCMHAYIHIYLTHHNITHHKIT